MKGKFENINIREARISDLETISQIHVDAWKDNYRDIVPNEIIEKMFYDIQERKWKKRLFEENTQNEKMYVLEVNNKIRGFASGNVIDENIARINTIYFESGAKKQGYGTRLFDFMKEVLGRKMIEVWCFEENKNRAFYEKLGGKIADEQIIELGTKSVKEIKYVFGER